MSKTAYLCKNKYDLKQVQERLFSEGKKWIDDTAQLHYPKSITNWIVVEGNRFHYIAVPPRIKNYTNYLTKRQDNVIILPIPGGYHALDAIFDL